VKKRYRSFHPLSYQGLQSLNEAFVELQRRKVEKRAAGHGHDSDAVVREKRS